MRLILIGFVGLMFTACSNNKNYEAEIANPEHVRKSFKKYSDVIVYDIFSPPVASRNYVYASIAAYEVLAQLDDRYVSLSGQLHDLEPTPSPPTEEVSLTISAMEALLTTAKHFIFSESKIDEYRTELMNEIRGHGVPKSVMKRSQEYGSVVAQHIIEWSKGDLYHQTRTFPKFSITDNPSEWKPTPPGYMDGIEPHWNRIRTMVLDSATQFIPKPPTEFDLDKNSKFFQETMEVYEVGLNATEEHKEIASFWDCNPYVLNVTGHVMHATKKITPGGHWIGIVGLSTRKADFDLGQTIEAYALTSIALFDAFISCWDEKYRSKLIRPESVINEHIDQDWLPILQTPPFPEHTSGHSVISRAAAIALTSILGDEFAFDDDVELEYGLPIRSFTSFIHASEEAAISRLYGGIHYRPAIDYGVEQGEKVGKLVVDRVKMKA